MYNQLINTINGWNFSKSEIDEAILANNVLLNPSIDFTNACNLNCSYCFIEDKNSLRKKRRTNELTLKESLEIIDDLAHLNARTINIVGAGEPTLYENFYEIIEYINKKGLTSVLFTNGLKLLSDKEMIPFLYKNNVSIILKYNSDYNDLQDLIVGKSDYTVNRNKVLNLLIDYKFNKSQTTRLGIDTIVFKGNFKELPNIHKWCRENNIFPISANFIPTGRTKDSRLQMHFFNKDYSESQIKILNEYLQPISHNDSIWLYNQNKIIDEKYNIFWNQEIAYYNGGTCSQILGLYIDIEGNIWPCVARSFNRNGRNEFGLLGNIRNGDSIESIWKNHPYIKKTRKNFNGGCPYKTLKLTKSLMEIE